MDENKEGDTQPVSELASLVERQEKANAKKEELLIREEKLEAVKRMGGQTYNAPVIEKPKEESPKDYARRVEAGRL